MTDTELYLAILVVVIIYLAGNDRWAPPGGGNHERAEKTT